MTLGSLAYFLASKLQTLASYSQLTSFVRVYVVTHILIARSTLSYNPSIPPRVIVKIEHGVSTGFENSLDEDIVFTQESGVERGGSLIVSYNVLPSEWESEAVISPLANVEGRREM
jgi:hypothetical protein